MNSSAEDYSFDDEFNMDEDKADNHPSDPTIERNNNTIKSRFFSLWENIRPMLHYYYRVNWFCDCSLYDAWCFERFTQKKYK
ncbi:hypothetical protein [Piscirickettsia salmonis]|uniref:hypothetical protein n=1 Tax=Piscirickettsia salmonis TaxID=1238 RepID=UPI001013D3C3|nr:hypothetical protein [Piscirickettsia salmonis]